MKNLFLVSIFFISMSPLANAQGQATPPTCCKITHSDTVTSLWVNATVRADQLESSTTAEHEADVATLVKQAKIIGCPGNVAYSEAVGGSEDATCNKAPSHNCCEITQWHTAWATVTALWVDGVRKDQLESKTKADNDADRTTLTTQARIENCPAKIDFSESDRGEFPSCSAK